MISDAYTVQFLLEATQAAPPRVVWHESGAAGLATTSGRVLVDMSRTTDRAGTRISVRFREGHDSFALHEPMNQGWLNRRYASEDEARLADLLGDLWRAARNQAQGHAETEQIRDRLYRQLLFEQ